LPEAGADDQYFQSLIGSSLSNRYRLLSILGRGGWGVVFKAHDSRIDRIVAIKMLRAIPNLAEEHFARFEREAMAASKLNHPHIITIFDLIWEQNPYLIMDFINGVSLQEVLQTEQRLSEERALHIFLQACDALLHAHKKGVIHRDVKPSNLMLTKDDEGRDFLKVVDFGIARLDEANGAAVKLTATGTFFGTPTYMSPEQCMGQKLDSRSDIYSFGCVMYQTLAGALPIVGESALAVIHAHISQVPPAFRDVCPDLKTSDNIESIVFKALAKDAKARHQSMQELKEELVDLMQGRSPVNKTRLPETASDFFADRARSRKPKEVEDVVFKEEDVLLNAIEELEEQEGKDSPALVPTLEKLGALYAEFEEYTAAEKVYKRAIDIFRKHYGESVSTAELMRELAKLYVEQARFNEAERVYRSVLNTVKSAFGDEDQELIYCYEDLATVVAQQKRFAEAEQLLHDANVVLTKVFGVRHIEYANLLRYFADIYELQNNVKETEHYLRKALSIAEEVLEHNDLTLVPFLQDLATLKDEQGQTEEAKQLLKRAFTIAHSPQNKESEELVSVCLTLGEMYYCEEDYAKSERFFRLALDASEAIFGTGSWHCYEPLIFVGDCAAAKDRLETAEKFYKQAHKIGLNCLSGDDPAILPSTSRLGLLYNKLGASDKAERALLKCVEIADEHLEKDSLDRALHLFDLGDFYAKTRRFAQAEPLLRKSLRIYEEKCDRTDEQLWPILETMLDVCRHLGKTKEAKQIKDWLEEFDS
jgi:serine/threonine protein kinase